MDEASNLVPAVRVIFQHVAKRLGYGFGDLVECMGMDPDHRVKDHGLVGASAGLGLGGAVWRRGRAAEVESAGVGERAREQLQLTRRRHGEGR